MSPENSGSLIVDFITPAAAADPFVLIPAVSALDKNKIVYKKILPENFGPFIRSCCNARTIYNRMLIENSRYVVADAYKLNPALYGASLRLHLIATSLHNI